MSNPQDPYGGVFEQGPPAGGAPHRRPPAAEPPPAPAPPPRPAEQFHGDPPDWPTEVHPAVDGPPPRHQSAPHRSYAPQDFPPPQPQYRPTPGLVEPRRGGHYAGGDALPVPARQPATVEGSVGLDRLDVRRRKVPPKAGWRRTLHTLTRINLGPGKDESYEIGLVENVQRPIRTTFTVAVIGLKGGVGKTVVSEGLGSTLGLHRGDRVIAMDADPDGGNLIMRHGVENQLSIHDLVDDTSVVRYHDVRAHTSQNGKTRLEVLAGPDYAGSDRVIDTGDFQKALGILQEHYAVVVVDCGIGLKTELIRSVLAEAGAVVVVTSASIDAMHETRDALAWLRNAGYQRLLDTAVLAINRTEAGRPNVDVAQAIEQFSREIRPDRIFELPFDRHLHEGKEITLELLNKKTRRRYLEIAAALSDLYPRTVN